MTVYRFIILAIQFHPLAISLPYHARNDKHVKLNRDYLSGAEQFSQNFYQNVVWNFS